MLIKKSSDIQSSEITPESFYRDRRQFIRTGVAAIATTAAGLSASGCTEGAVVAAPQSGRFDTDEAETPFEAVTTYNNFYEFGTGKEDPARNAHTLEPRPWSVEVDGMVTEPKTWDLDDLLSGFTMEDRVYRMRCVEGWSMVIPWHGFPMADLINKLEPLPGAKYVYMETLVDPEQMPGQSRGFFGGYTLDWPYREGLRMDEAMNPLTLMAVGVYGQEGPNQNGAPIRLVVPWKYGFKGVKSIVKISFIEEEPLNTWQQENAREYGFFANVNPNVDHPRWSQARERRIGELFQRETLMFNGYTEQVAHLYDGMDLRRYF
jgi:sulfoxide reductase catalytic subunit YedY